MAHNSWDRLVRRRGEHFRAVPETRMHPFKQTSLIFCTVGNCVRGGGERPIPHLCDEQLGAASEVLAVSSLAVRWRMAVLAGMPLDSGTVEAENLLRRGGSDSFHSFHSFRSLHSLHSFHSFRSFHSFTIYIESTPPPEVPGGESAAPPPRVCTIAVPDKRVRACSKYPCRLRVHTTRPGCACAASKHGTGRLAYVTRP